MSACNLAPVPSSTAALSACAGTAIMLATSAQIPWRSTTKTLRYEPHQSHEHGVHTATLSSGHAAHRHSCSCNVYPSLPQSNLVRLAGTVHPPIVRSEGLRALVIWRRRAMVLGASGSDRKRRRSARPTATYAAGTHGNWCASLRPKSSTCSTSCRNTDQHRAGQHPQIWCTSLRPESPVCSASLQTPFSKTTGSWCTPTTKHAAAQRTRVEPVSSPQWQDVVALQAHGVLRGGSQPCLQHSR